MKRIFAVAILAGTAFSAQAADMAKAPVYKAPAPMLYDWTGFYAGVNVGVGLGRDLTQDVRTVAGGNTATQSYLGPIGAIGGGQLGYNWQFGSGIVVGVETDLQGSGMRDSSTCVNSCTPGTSLQYNQKLDWFGTARARLGLATGPVLSYITGGFGYGNASTTVTDTSPVQAPPSTVATFSGTRSGWTFGSGVEASLGGNWTAKLEYLYLSLGTQSGTYVSSVAGANLPRAFSSDIRESIFRGGLNYRFGGNGAYSEPLAHWAGLYAGGNVGGGLARNESSLTAAANAETFNLMPSGFVGGGQLGYNWQAGNLVFGIETDFQGSTQKDDKACGIACTPALFATYDQRLPWFGTTRGRIGYSIGATLFYGTAGVAYGEVKTTIAESNGIATEFNQTKTGWTAGAGVESPFNPFNLLGPNWTSTTEYLYVDLGTATSTYAGVLGATTFSTHVQEHIFRTGINYHFNAPVVARY